MKELVMNRSRGYWACRMVQARNTPRPKGYECAMTTRCGECHNSPYQGPPKRVKKHNPEPTTDRGKRRKA